MEKRYRNALILLIILGVILLAGPFDIYSGGWEVRTHAVKAKADTGVWINTAPAQWEHDFDAKYHGAPDLVIDSGLDPVHVNQYFYPSAKSEPAYVPITKTVGVQEFVYDVHLYTMDITLRVDGDYLMTETAGSNSFETEASYSHDKSGDFGSHTYTVQFLFEIAEWAKFADEADSWAGIMSIFTYKQPTVGIQPYRTDLFPEYQNYQQTLRTDLNYDFKGDYTEVVHNPFPATQGSKLNMWTTGTQAITHQEPDSVSPDQRIPQQVYFDLSAEFRCGALIGEDNWGNEESIYILDPFVIFHVAFEVLAVHEFYLESEPTTITQETPVPAGVPPTKDAEGPWYENLAEALDDLWPFGGLQGLVVFILVAVVVIMLAPYITSALLGRKMLR